MNKKAFKTLIEFLEKVPAIIHPIDNGASKDGMWWVKFQIDINHALAWQVIQEIGHVVNYISIEERLPSWFYPVSPPPYLNGGPEECLSWVIETTTPDFRPSHLQEWLKGRLPNPVDDLSQWSTD